MLYLILLISIILNPVPEYVLAIHNIYEDFVSTKYGILNYGYREANPIVNFFFFKIGINKSMFLYLMAYSYLGRYFPSIINNLFAFSHGLATITNYYNIASISNNRDYIKIYLFIKEF